MNEQNTFVNMQITIFGPYTYKYNRCIEYDYGRDHCLMILPIYHRYNVTKHIKFIDSNAHDEFLRTIKNLYKRGKVDLTYFI
jgi:hypothetical protein